MNCTELAERIHRLEPEATDTEVARLCLLIANSVESLEQMDSDAQLKILWREMGLKMQAATDQHAAMTQELEDLAKSDPAKFSKEQIWILIRAIKVQSQILQLYLGNTPL
ncbi:MAG: hypothetical protein KDB27_36000, partial [Planctomycetales bacterium]|nr:hypothetical protein [Planctomycetales bacterium]